MTSTGQLDPTQVYTTPNIVQPTSDGSGTTPWVGGVYQDNLTCWGWGDPGYCGPNPIVRPGGSINFSYGMTNLYQMQTIANILPNTGTGLKVDGYNFGFTAKNGNGWDDGRMDYLTAYVNFYDPKGSTVFNKNYDLNSRFNWTTFNYSETFNSPFASKDLGSVQYGFVGRDNNFWAGPYGPEIYNVNFSLKYSVDPCATNILSSPTCPGYFDALAKLTPKISTTTGVTEPTPTGVQTTIDGVTITTSGIAPPPGSPPPPPPGSPPPPEGSQPPPPPSGPAPAGAPGPISQVASTQPAPSGQQTKVGEASDSSGGSKSTVSLSSVLNMIGSNQEKTAALEKSVVQAADAQAFSASETAKQSAEKLAGDVQSQSIANSGGSAQTGTALSSSTQSVTQLQGSSISMQGSQQGNFASNSARLQQSINSASMGIQSDTSTSSVTTQEQSASRYSLFQIESQTTEGIKFGYKGPVDSAIESKPIMTQSDTGRQQNYVTKKNIQNNEAAGNVTIESIAKQPVNYAQYFGTMPDVAFYAPKEIYRNQRVIDNTRVLRQMSSDRLHQEMVNQQYK